MARPKKEIDEELVFKLASIGCTYQELADFFQIDKSTIVRRFAPIIKEGHQDMKQSLRRAQLKAAIENNNVTMQIWLGKQMLGQKDQPKVIYEGVSKVTATKKK